MEEERLYDVYALDEDIKILEKLKEDGKETFTDTKLSDYEIQALEHLIEAYRKQEEIIKTYNAIPNDYMSNDVKIIIADREYFNNGILKENLIPKSKIKEKIEELEQTRKSMEEYLLVSNNSLNIQAVDEQIIALKSLLEDKEE